MIVGHNLDVCTSAALRGGLKRLIEFSTCAYTRGKPVVASQRLRHPQWERRSPRQRRKLWLFQGP
jgi:hypothetical protein